MVSKRKGERERNEDLEVQHVVKTYGSHQNQVTALSDVSFAAEQGEFIAIVGTSGSGKSTLLNLLGGLDVPTEGKISIRGHDIGSLTRKNRRFSEEEISDLYFRITA